MNNRESTLRFVINLLLQVLLNKGDRNLKIRFFSYLLTSILQTSVTPSAATILPVLLLYSQCCYYTPSTATPLPAPLPFRCQSRPRSQTAPRQGQGHGLRRSQTASPESLWNIISENCAAPLLVKAVKVKVTDRAAGTTVHCAAGTTVECNE